jgi:hypothetical protein
MKILIFDRNNDFIRATVAKVKGARILVSGKEADDVSKFEPDIVLCHQNREVVERCISENVRCLQIYTLPEYEITGKSIACTRVIPFDYNEVAKSKTDDLFTLTNLEEGSRYIAGMIASFKPGTYNVFNHGIVGTKYIHGYYNIESDFSGKHRDFTMKETKMIHMSPISEFFTDPPDRKVNVYIPTYYRFEKTKASVESLIKFGRMSKYDVKFYIGDNNTKITEMREWLASLEADDVKIHLCDVNRGKSGMVNRMVRDARKCEYVMSIDSDMLANHNYIDDMIFHLTRIENCGLVSANQDGCSQHWWGKTVFSQEKYGLKVGFSEQNVGIAGGCIVMRSYDWLKIGMYKEGHDVYTGDDGIVMGKVNRVLGKDVYVSENCSLFHPFPDETEKGYVEWKMKSWQRDNVQFLKEGYTGSNQKGYWD